MKYFKLFENFSVNEDLHPHFFDCGFYDAANGNTETLVELLQANNVEHTFDEMRNYVVITTTDPRNILPFLEEARIVKVPLNDEMYMKEDPNDCVLLRMPAPNVPPGAMM